MYDQDCVENEPEVMVDLVCQNYAWGAKYITTPHFLGMARSVTHLLCKAQILLLGNYPHQVMLELCYPILISRKPEHFYLISQWADDNFIYVIYCHQQLRI